VARVHFSTVASDSFRQAVLPEDLIGPEADKLLVRCGWSAFAAILAVPPLSARNPRSLAIDEGSIAMNITRASCLAPRAPGLAPE
jgi:hypothetical protein